MEVMGLFFFLFLVHGEIGSYLRSFDCIAAMDKGSHYISFLKKKSIKFILFA